MNYYSENDRRAAEWLRQLIKEWLIPDGKVDERDIREVHPQDLEGYVQCHFFAGIGGWSYALRLAGWPDTVPVWTGSCPCQPFSAAGKQKGTQDHRHLWPEFARLIRECRPSVCFGEQVASNLGREWLSGVRADLEGMGYAVGAADLCAAGEGAPHIRQRLYWLADAANANGRAGIGRAKEGTRPHGKRRRGLASRGDACGLADAGHGKHGWPHECESGIADTSQRDEATIDAQRCGIISGLGDASRAGLPTPELEAVLGTGRGIEGRATAESGGSPGPWSDFDLIHCLDGKTRRVESGTFPLAHGIPGRVGLLRGYGNAIVPQVAATFVRALMEANQ